MPGTYSYYISQSQNETFLEVVKALESRTCPEPISVEPNQKEQEDQECLELDAPKPKRKKTTNPAKKKEKKQEVSAEEPSAKPLAVASDYRPGSFSEARKEFIASKRKASGVSYAEANQAWMLSSQRADLLSGLSPQELKRRKFT